MKGAGPLWTLVCFAPSRVCDIAFGFPVDLVAEIHGDEIFSAAKFDSQ